jgi:hypothetical protein
MKPPASNLLRPPLMTVSRPFGILRGAAWAAGFSLMATSCGGDEPWPASMGLIPFEDLGPGGLDSCQAPERTAKYEPGMPLVLDSPSGFPCVLVAMPPHVVITSPDAETGPSPAGRMVVMESGRFVSTGQPTMQGTILQWDRDGSFLRSYGRRGQGPGEFAGGDELLLFAGPGAISGGVDGDRRD